MHPIFVGNGNFLFIKVRKNTRKRVKIYYLPLVDPWTSPIGPMGQLGGMSKVKN